MSWASLQGGLKMYLPVVFFSFFGGSSVSLNWFKWTILLGGRRHIYIDKEYQLLPISSDMVTLIVSFLLQIDPSNTGLMALL